MTSATCTAPGAARRGRGTPTADPNLPASNFETIIAKIFFCA
jgi:hypothetical protein